MTTENAQLSLIETPRSWRLDKHTREVGREGVARARAALRAGRHSRLQDPPLVPARGDTHPRSRPRPHPGAGRAAA
jgi:hypothetical protein